MALSPGTVSTREDIAGRLQRMDLDIVRQRRIMSELERDGLPSTGARTLLRLLEDARRAWVEQL